MATINIIKNIMGVDLTRLPVVTVAILLVAALSIYVLAQLSVSRLHYQRGIEYLEVDQLTKAESELLLASHYLPRDGLPFGNDTQRLSVAFGKLYYLKAFASTGFQLFVKTLSLSADQYDKAVSVNPLAATVVAGLANTVAAQQEVFTWMHPGSENLYNPLPMYQRAIELRPSAIAPRYNYILYLARQEDKLHLEAAVTALASISPGSYRRLKKEKFYRAYREAVKKGVIEASKKEIIGRGAYFILSAMALEEGDTGNAFYYYKQMLAVADSRNSVRSYIHAGKLALLNVDFNQASVYFLQSLELSEDRENTIRSIYREYSRLDANIAFVRFAKRGRDTFNLSDVVDICIARSLQDAGQIELAKSRLKRIDTGTYAGESLYYLAKIYQQEKDWDNMEIASQRATVLNPEEARYQHLFSLARKYQHK